MFFPLITSDLTSWGLFQILESVEFNKKTKMSTAKPTEFSCILKVSKQQLGTKPYQVRLVFHYLCITLLKSSQLDSSIPSLIVDRTAQSVLTFERIECHKTKTKFKVITPAHHKLRKLINEPFSRRKRGEVCASESRLVWFYY